ncbi:hypothetical protein C8255_19010 [filamentous cyanobacterium CCP3]|nr:hypothetical protein C8255_19010 [filamentous cyanobacterium CCP3]
MFKIKKKKGELLKASKKRYPLNDSYMEREWDRFEKDVMQVPPNDNAEDKGENNVEKKGGNDHFILEQRTFNLLLSFCFIGDVGYDPDDVNLTSPATTAQSNGTVTTNPPALSALENTGTAREPAAPNAESEE